MTTSSDEVLVVLRKSMLDGLSFQEHTVDVTNFPQAKPSFKAGTVISSLRGVMWPLLEKRGHDHSCLEC